MTINEFVAWAVDTHGCELKDIPKMMSPRGQVCVKTIRRFEPDGSLRMCSLPELTDHDQESHRYIEGFCRQLGIDPPDDVK